MAAQRTRWGRLGLGLIAVLAVGEAAPQVAKESGGGPRLWHSPNARPVPAFANRVTPSVRLGELAHGRHFDRYGTPPAYEFLEVLMAPPATLARIEQGMLLFPLGGARIPLTTQGLPREAAPMQPSLLATPDSRWILVVLPYYLPPGREVRHRVQAYRPVGTRVGHFDTLPTHVLQGVPDVLVARDRIVLSTGYCEGLRWSFRFYDLARMTVAEYGCPEGRCGDALFTRLAASGHLLVALEAVEEMPERGRVAATWLYILDGQGTLVASGAFAGIEGGAATRGGSDAGGCATAEVVAARSPFAVRNLQAVEPIPSESGWRVRFSGNFGVREYHLSGKWEGTQGEMMP